MQGLKNFSPRERGNLISSKWHIPLSDLDYGAEEEDAVLRVLRSKWLSMGAEVEAFEREFADFLGVRHAVAVTNGTAALHLSYLAFGLGPGDEIIQPAVNFVAAANMTVAVGATPIFADIVGLEEPTINPADIECRITKHTKAVVVMHYGGYICRMHEISLICQRHRLTLIEDACHAVGARYLDQERCPPHGRMAGNLGDIACFSFFSNKNLASGEGGMVVTNQSDLADRLRLLRSHGMTRLAWDRYHGRGGFYDVVLHGYNYRLDELRAALGRSQLRKLVHINRLRKQLVSVYQRNLTGLQGWIIPFADCCSDSAYHLMALVAPDEETRKRTVEALEKAGIQTSWHYPCIPDFEAFKRFRRNGIEHSRSYAKRVMTLPLFASMTKSQVEKICSIIRNVSVETS